MMKYKIGYLISNASLLNEAHNVERLLPSSVVMNTNHIPSLEWLGQEIEKHSPDILFVDVSGLTIPLNHLVESIRNRRSPPRIVALNPTPDSDKILLALRSGVSEFLVPPFHNSWEDALDKLAAEIAAERTGTHTGTQLVGFLSAKGGCGATTIACHVAAAIRKQFRPKTLLIDLDMEAGAVAFVLRAGGRYSVVDALNNIPRMDESFWRALVISGPQELNILRASMDVPPEMFPTAEAIRRLLAFVRPLYNWTVIDLGRGLGFLTMNSLRDLDMLYVVTTFELPALRQCKHLVQVLTEHRFSKDRLRLIVNRMPKSTPVGMGDLEKLLGLPVYFTLSNQYHPLMTAYEGGELVDCDTKLGTEFLELAGKVVGGPPDAEQSSQRKSFLSSIFGRSESPAPASAR